MPGISMTGGNGRTMSMTVGLPGQEEIGRGQRIIIVLPFNKGSTALKTGKIHSVNSIHALNNHLDGGYTNR